jgi:hypothetical protein
MRPFGGFNSYASLKRLIPVGAASMAASEAPNAEDSCALASSSPQVSCTEFPLAGRGGEVATPYIRPPQVDPTSTTQ